MTEAVRELLDKDEPLAKVLHRHSGEACPGSV